MEWLAFNTENFVQDLGLGDVNEDYSDNEARDARFIDIRSLGNSIRVTFGVRLFDGTIVWGVHSILSYECSEVTMTSSRYSSKIASLV